MIVKNMVLILEEKKCCGGLFTDDVVLIAPSAKNLEKLLKKVHKWANLNEMTFGIEKMCNYGYKTNELPISSKL